MECASGLECFAISGSNLEALEGELAERFRSAE
jgi:hypothetical protein